MNKVVVTGSGIICPLGADKLSTFAAALEARSGIGACPADVAARLPHIVVAQASVDPETLLERADQGLDRATQFALVAAAQAITEAGDVVVASASASQLGPYASTAGRLILVVGSQKIVPDLDQAFRRIEQHVFPYEEAVVRARMNRGTFIGKILIIRREWVDGRVTVVLVREPVGV